MPNRHFPVRPNLVQLKHQARDLLRSVRTGDPEALADFHEFHPSLVHPPPIRLSDAQFTLARSYGLPSWARLVTACRMTDAIWRAATLRRFALW